MGAGGDGPCLASWLLRCAETSLSKWNPQPDWQAGRRAASNRSSQLWLHPEKVGPVQNLPGSANKLVDIAAHTGRPPAPPGPGPRVQGQALPPS